MCGRSAMWIALRCTGHGILPGRIRFPPECSGRLATKEDANQRHCDCDVAAVSVTGFTFQRPQQVSLLMHAGLHPVKSLLCLFRLHRSRRSDNRHLPIRVCRHNWSGRCRVSRGLPVCFFPALVGIFLGHGPTGARLVPGHRCTPGDHRA